MVQRKSYTVLDLLSDVGGIASILFSGCAFALGFWNYKHLDSFMVSQLFKMAGSDDSSFFRPTKVGNLKNFCIDCLPRRLVCCTKSSRQMALE